MSSSKKLLTSIIGFGSLGSIAANSWDARIGINGISHTFPSYELMQRISFFNIKLTPIIDLNLLTPVLEAIAKSDWINFWLPFRSHQISTHDYISILDIFLSCIRKDQLLTFTSSTSVFKINELIHEFTPANSEHPLSIIESHIIKKHPYHHIIRLAGLISEKRNPIYSLLKNNTLTSPWTPINLIHELDAVRFILHLKNHPIWGKREIITNLSSSTHLSRFQYYHNVARKIGLPNPNFDIQDQSSQPSRIVMNDFLYPKYRFRLKHLHV